MFQQRRLAGLTKFKELYKEALWEQQLKSKL